jgi:hypothetical protein
MNQRGVEIGQAVSRGESQTIRIAGGMERLGTDFVVFWHLFDPFRRYFPLD